MVGQQVPPHPRHDEHAARIPRARDGILERPLLGWGYNGFGLAMPYVNDFDTRFKIYLAQETVQRSRRELAELIRRLKTDVR